MFALIIFAISFFIFASTGALGGDIIYALDVVENWYWFIFAIIGLIAVGVTLFGTAMGAAAGSDMTHNKTIGGLGGALAGYSMGAFLSALMLAKIGIQLWLTIWLMDTIDPAITEWGMLESKEAVGLVVLLVLSFINPSSSSSKSK